MPKKLGLFFLWILLTPIVLTTSIFLLQYFSKVEKVLTSTKSLITQGVSLNSLEGQILGVHVSDMRPHLVAKILEKTPLASYSQYMVEISDKYDIDYRLIPAIALKETGAGKNAPKNSYNAWGFENGRTKFQSWEQAIDIVGKTLKERYIAKGLVTPEQIMPIYAPPAVEAGGKWAQDINYFYSKMENF